MSEEPDVATVVGLLDEQCARCILTATNVDPMSATELADACDVSLPTVTRHVDDLLATDLLEERTRLREDGHHDTVYAATLEGVEIRLVDDELTITVNRTDRDAADELVRLWKQL